MARPKKNTENVESGSIFDLVKSIDNEAEIIADSAYSNIKDYISTGNYILNAAITGDMFKGLPTGRICSFFGPNQTGKSFLQCSVCREAQKKGYTPIILDSEGSLDATFVSRIGVDPTKCIIKQVNTISETSKFIANLCKALEEQEKKTGTHDKVIIVLDSLGNLTSDKEKEDIIAGNQKRDLTKAQEVKAMFRVNATPLARLGILWIVINHSYASIGSYVPTQVQASGSGIQYNSSVTLELSTKKLEDKENDVLGSKKQGNETAIKNGVLITAKPVKSRFTIPRKVSFQIPFHKKMNPYVGLEEYLNWDNAGIMFGKLYTEAEYLKLKPAEQNQCKEFMHNGEKLYAMEKKTAMGKVGMIVKHLGQQLSLQDFYSEKVFTPEFMEQINETIIKPMFQLPDHDSFEDIKELEEIMQIEN